MLPLHSQSLPQLLQPPKSTPAPATENAQASTANAPPPSKAIPLPQVADQAEELDRLLREISRNLEVASDLPVSDPEAKMQTEQIAQRANETEELLNGIPNMVQLQGEDRYWHALAEEYGSKRKLLSIRAARIEEKMRWLDGEEGRWKATLDAVKDKPGVEIVAQRVRQEMDSIDSVRLAAGKKLNQVLTLQNTISEQDREIELVLRKLDEAHERLRGRLFERDSYPLWKAHELRAAKQPMSTVVLMSASRGFTGAWSFLRMKKIRLIGMAVMFVFSLVLAVRLKRRFIAESAREVEAKGAQIFMRPLAIALLLTLLATIGITTSAPTGVSFVVSLLYLVPVLRLLPLLTRQEMRKVLYALSILYVLQWEHLVLEPSVVFKREIFVIVIFAALVSFGWLTRPSRLKIPSKPDWLRKLKVAGIQAGLFLLAASVLANILGFVSLSQVLGVGTLFSAFSLALLYTTARALNLSVAVVVNSTWFESLPDGHGEVIKRWAWRLLVIGGTILWLNVNLYLFTVRNSVMETLRDVLQYPIGYGKVHVTLGGTLSIFLLLLLGYLIANVASFILGKILLPRFSLRGGMAYAISRVTYYILLVALFFAALANAGLELNKFTVITGALGLGVGFGLQNIVSNFASGLIVLFERPIRVSDTVEIGGVTGIVRRIGARSSTVVTAQGAEVIFPNSNLLSNQVTNWTLSSTRRRVEIPVGVGYGTDPEVVLALLTGIANNNSRVLSYPAPQTSFLGFGENALNFELTFWAPQSVWFELKSEIGLTILRALRKAGIEIPYPQRDLHVRSIDSEAKEENALASGAEPEKKTVAIR